VLSFWSLDLQLHRLFSMAALERMGRFVLELSRPELSGDFLTKLGLAAFETLAMSFVGTLLAALAGLVLAFMATDTPDSHPSIVALSRLLLNLLRSVPDLMWAAILIIASGLGPMAGTLALALHTAGVLGRLFADASENAADHERETLRLAGVRPIHCFLYATLPSIIPQLLSYTLYRWENNIRAAAVLGVVGAGGLGQMLSFHMGLFQMNETSSILIVMILLVVLVDSLSYLTRRILMR
ncbi:MAG: phosphonate ABC transporter, permease protein PhnE, partial [Burkholderiaceae bacterium]